MARVLFGRPRAIALRKLAVRVVGVLQSNGDPRMVLTNEEMSAIYWASMIIDDENPGYEVVLRDEVGLRWDTKHALKFETYAED